MSVKLSTNGLEVLKRRYLARNDKGEIIETPEDLFRRVASTVAAAEKKYEATDVDIAAWTEDFYTMMSNLDFLPNSPTLMNAGRPLGQLSACFVLPIPDTMDDIFNTLHDAAMIHKSGGGTGFSFSRLRSKGTIVTSTGGQASGPISFMHAYDAATGTVAQGGKRRGANMGILRVDHPDILEFIKTKRDLKELNNFNLSVGITETFMRALESGGIYDLVDPFTNEVVNSLVAADVFNEIVKSAWMTGEPGIIFLDRVNETNWLKPLYGEIEATNPCLWGGTKITINNDGKIQEYPIRDLVDKEVQVWTGYEWSNVIPRKTGENQKSLIFGFSNGSHIHCTLYHKFLMADASRIEAKDLKVNDELYAWVDPKTGEITKCTVTSIKDGRILDEVFCLYEPIRHTFMANGVVVGNCGEQPLLPYEACNLGSINLANFVKGDAVDYTRLGAVVRLAVRFLDDVIDVNHYPLPKIEKMVMDTRKIGLGVMGFADMLQLLNIGYATEEGIELGRSIMKFIQDTAHSESLKLGQARGVYPAYTKIEKLYAEGKASDHIVRRIPYRRNAMVTTIAPTGSISAIAGVSSGIEPLFSNVFYKHYMDDDYHPIVNERLMEELEDIGSEDWVNSVKKVVMETGTVAHIESVPDYVKQVYACAHDITPDAHVLMQAAFQENVDNAISKTVNFNENATEADIKRTYELAYRLGCKGITVYRDKCRDTQVLNVGRVEDKDKKEDQKANINTLTIDMDAGMSDDQFKETVSSFIKRTSPNLDVFFFNRVTPGDVRAQLQSVIDSNLSEHQYLHPDLLYRALVEFSDDRKLWDMVYKIPEDCCKELLEYCKDRLGIPKDEDAYANVNVVACDIAEAITCQAKHDSTEVQDRPEILEGSTRKVDINCGKLYLTVNHDLDGRLFEVFSTTGKSGGCPAQSEAVCRLASLCLRAGIDLKEITRQLRGIKCMACMKNPNIKVFSCPDAIGRELERVVDTVKPVDTDVRLPLGKATIVIPELANPFRSKQPMSERLANALRETACAGGVDPSMLAHEYMKDEVDKEITTAHERQAAVQKAVSDQRELYPNTDPRHHVKRVLDNELLDAAKKMRHYDSTRIVKGGETIAEKVTVDDKDVCPQCGAELKHIGGCKNCLQCGYSSCG